MAGRRKMRRMMSFSNFEGRPYACHGPGSPGCCLLVRPGSGASTARAGGSRTIARLAAPSPPKTSRRRGNMVRLSFKDILGALLAPPMF